MKGQHFIEQEKEIVTKETVLSFTEEISAVYLLSQVNHFGHNKNKMLYCRDYHTVKNK